ncbi:hypothetical protein ACS0TY_020994 [Phlomoides rotata]
MDEMRLQIETLTTIVETMRVQQREILDVIAHPPPALGHHATERSGHARYERGGCSHPPRAPSPPNSDNDEMLFVQNPFFPDYPIHHHSDNRWEQGFRVEIPEFNGSVQP